MLLQSAVKNLLFKKMCDELIVGNAGTINFVSDEDKNQEIFNKSVDNYAHALEFVPDCHKNKKNV